MAKPLAILYIQLFIYNGYLRIYPSADKQLLTYIYSKSQG